jgi:hypothetical protein
MYEYTDGWKKAEAVASTRAREVKNIILKSFYWGNSEISDMNVLCNSATTTFNTVDTVASSWKLENTEESGVQRVCTYG